MVVQAVHSATLYGRAAARLVVRGGREIRLPLGEPCGRHVFVVGCPRSGTTFLAGVLGEQPGLIDLGEASPVKAAIPELAQLSDEDAAARLRLILARVRRLGLVAHLRGVEQTPEMCFVLGPALQAHPEARAVHMLRDGRDVVCSLLERGWLKAARPGRDEVGQPHGAHARFWVEPERREEFTQVTDARRCAWAWRRYVEAVRGADAGDRLIFQQDRHQGLRPVVDELGHLEKTQCMSGRSGVEDNCLHSAGLDRVDDVNDRRQFVDAWGCELDQAVHCFAIVTGIDVNRGRAPMGDAIKQRIDALGVSRANARQFPRRVNLADFQVRRRATDPPLGFADRLAEHMRQ